MIAASARDEVEASANVSQELFDADACFARALAFENAQGVRANAADALSWFVRAARAGHVEAQWRAARLLMHGAPSLDHAARSGAGRPQGSEASVRRVARLFPNGFAVAKDEGAAIPWLMQAATAHHPDACFALALLFLDGQHVERRLDLARILLEKAAHRGHGPARFKLGDIYFQGLGVTPDAVRAADHYEAAVTQKVALASYALSTLYREGAGRARDPARSIALLRDAVDAGIPAAMVDLARLTLAGTEVPQDHELAEELLRTAAKNNSLRAFIALAEMFSRGSGVQPDLPEAARWYRRAAEAGDSEAQFIMGHLTATGRGVPLDVLSAADWFEQAAAQGHATAAHNLASLYLQGNESSVRKEEAVALLRKAADAGILASEIRYAELSAGELDTDRLALLSARAGAEGSADQKARVAFLLIRTDPAAAEMLLRAAADEGDVRSALALGQLCARDEDDPTRVAEAASWFRHLARRDDPDLRFEAAEALLRMRGHESEAVAFFADGARAGHAPSHFRLGVLHSTGNGLSQSLPQAVEHYEAAAQAGHPAATFNLGILLLRGQGCPADEERGSAMIRRAAELGVAEAQALINDA